MEKEIEIDRETLALTSAVIWAAAVILFGISGRKVALNLILYDKFHY
jgi:hypothetical protein